MTISPAALWLNTVFASFDQNVTVLVHRLYESAGGFWTPFFNFISLFGAAGGTCFIVLALSLTFYKPTRRYGTAMCLALAIGTIITNAFLKVYIARPRPYIDQNGFFYQFWILVGQHTESDKSFPSGHMTAAVETMWAVFLVGNRKYSWTAFIFAFVMGVARIYLVVHYPSDVLGGIAAGSVAGIAGYIVMTKIPQKWYEIDFVKRKVGRHEKAA